MVNIKTGFADAQTGFGLFFFFFFFAYWKKVFSPVVSLIYLKMLLTICITSVFCLTDYFICIFVYPRVASSDVCSEC